MSAEWSRPVSAEEAYRRAAGRRALNARRQFAAAERQVEVARRLAQYVLRHGVRARIAREVGVHPSTIGRDFQRLFESREAQHVRDGQRGAI